MDHEEDRNQRVTTAQKQITKIAFSPSKRQKELESRKYPNLSGREELLYKGEDLKRGSR